jgi:hypothetical protein
MTKSQRTILTIADDAKANGNDPIKAVREHFAANGEYISRARVVSILADMREEQRKELRQITNTQTPAFKTGEQA